MEKFNNTLKPEGHINYTSQKFLQNLDIIGRFEEIL
jgi:hypothetical protein